MQCLLPIEQKQGLHSLCLHMTTVGDTCTCTTTDQPLDAAAGASADKLVEQLLSVQQPLLPFLYSSHGRSLLQGVRHIPSMLHTRHAVVEEERVGRRLF